MPAHHWGVRCRRRLGKAGGYHVEMASARRFTLALLTFGVLQASGQSYRAPAGLRAALRHSGGASILPGGRVIAPAGDQYAVGSGTFGLALSPSGRVAATANSGPGRNSLTLMLH